MHTRMLARFTHSPCAAGTASITRRPSVHGRPDSHGLARPRHSARLSRLIPSASITLIAEKGSSYRIIRIIGS